MKNNSLLHQLLRLPQLLILVVTYFLVRAASKAPAIVDAAYSNKVYPFIRNEQDRHEKERDGKHDRARAAVFDHARCQSHSAALLKKTLARSARFAYNLRGTDSCMARFRFLCYVGFQLLPPLSRREARSSRKGVHFGTAFRGLYGSFVEGERAA